MAKQLQAPILLVVDGSAMARSAAAMVFGYAYFDPDVLIAGVVFNRVKSAGHFQLLKDSVEKEVNVPVVGYLQPHSDLSIPDRHLGLRTALESEDSDWYGTVVQATKETLDFSRIEQLADTAPGWEKSSTSDRKNTAGSMGEPIKIAVAHDPAFCFYYPDNLLLLEQAGGCIDYFSPLKDHSLPMGTEVLYLGGGYPEVYAKRVRTECRDEK